MYFDSHAHYDSRQFDRDREELLAALPAQGVECVIDPGCDGETSRLALDIAERHGYIYAAVGWHPQEWESWKEGSLDEIRALAAHPRAVAIGEIGLDYYWDKEHKELQEHMLRAQLELALELDKPVIIHDRDAHADCMAITLDYPALRGVYPLLFRQRADGAPAAGGRLVPGLRRAGDIQKRPPQPGSARRHAAGADTDRDGQPLSDAGAAARAAQRQREAGIRRAQDRGSEGLEPEAVARATAENARRLFNI